ncbi:MAG: sigma-B regulation protein RsbU (phosphoserine phosphatase) [Lentisphaeria bacterium]|jgi:sigma-B regulation protein RsbU (phosphoserine phosphatase)
MSRSNRQLLVIDDDLLVRESIVAYLEDSGFDVHEAVDGKQCLSWLEQNKPDAVLTDLRMPDIDGLAILSAVKAKDPQIPVIVISGMGDVRDVIEALRLGAADYLVKPLVDMEVLVHSINRALERIDLKKQNLTYRVELERANRELKEYVRVLERDQKAGRSVQRKLLPQSPAKFNDVNVDFKLIPSLYLSGDFVDFGLLSDRYLAFYLADVSGHGAASAFVTIWLKQLVRRYFRENLVFHSSDSFEQDAGKLLGLINKEVISSGIGCHMTCFVGVIDTETREMRYVFGGHLPFPVLVTEAGCQYLTGKGKPVGIFQDAQWKVNSISLPEKYSIIVCSDGILEVLPPDNLIDKEKYLLDTVKDNSASVESLVKAFGICDMENAPDDIAILKIDSE